METSLSSVTASVPGLNSETLERLRDLGMQYVNCAREEITPDSSFRSLGLDSLEVAALLMDIEEKFSVEIPLSHKIVTVRDVMAYL